MFLFFALVVGGFYYLAAVRESRWESYVSNLNRVSALRWGGEAGRRVAALDALARASKIQPSAELRDLAIACMALFDVQAVGSWKLTGAKDRMLAIDDRVEKYAASTANGDIVVRSIADDKELLNLPSGGGHPWVHGFSPDGRLVVLRSTGSSCRLIDLASGASIFEFSEPVANLVGVDFSPDGRWFALGPDDGSLRLIDIAERREWKRYDLGGGPIYSIGFHPNLEQVALSFLLGSEVLILDLATGNALAELRFPRRANEVAWHPEGRLLAVGCHDMKVYIWDASIPEGPSSVLRAHNGEVIGVSWLPRGHTLVSWGWDGQHCFWRAGNESPLLSVTGGGFRDYVPRAGRLALNGRTSGRVAAVEEPEEFRAFDPLLGQTISLGFDLSANGGLAAHGTNEHLRVWSLRGESVIGSFPFRMLHSVFFTPDAKTLITASTDGVFVWPVDHAESPGAGGDRILLGPSRAVLRGAPDASASLTADGKTLLWLSRGQVRIAPLDHLDEPVEFQVSPEHTDAVLSPDGRWLASFGWQRSDVVIWDVPGRKVVHRVPGYSFVAAASPDNRWIVTSSGRECQFWEVGTWRRGAVIPREEELPFATEMTFSDDGQLFAFIDPPSRVQLFGGDGQTALARLDCSERRSIRSVAFSGSDDILAAVPWNSHALEVWDLGKIRKRLAAMDLDWERPALGPSFAPEPISEAPEPRHSPEFQEELRIPNAVFLGEAGDVSGDVAGIPPDFWRAAASGKGRLDIGRVSLAPGAVHPESPVADAVLLRAASSDAESSFSSGASTFPLTPGRAYRARFWARSAHESGQDQRFSFSYLLYDTPPYVEGARPSRRSGGDSSLVATREWRLFSASLLVDDRARSCGLLWSLGGRTTGNEKEIHEESESDSGNGRTNALLIALPEMEQLIFPSDFTCEYGDRRVRMHWQKHALYESVKLFRDGEELVALAGGESSYEDLAPPPGRHRYEIEATLLQVARRSGAEIEVSP